MTTFDLNQIHRITGLKIEGSTVFHESGRLEFEGEDVDECITWLRGYVKGNLDGIRETMDKLGVEDDGA